MLHLKSTSRSAIVMVCAFTLVDTAFTQNSGEPIRPSIKNDANLPYPVPEGPPGRIDPLAIKELEACESISSLPPKMDLVIAGRLSTGIDRNSSGSAASLIMSAEGKLRMEIRDSEGRERGLRMIGRSGRIIGGPPSNRPPSMSDFGDPLMFPITLKNITFGKDIAIVDKGVMVVGEQRLHEVTVTHFPTTSPTRIATNVRLDSAVSLYFDPQSHLLLKSVVLNHSLMDIALQYLQITSYDKYRQVESIMTPSRYVETIDGQQVMVLDGTSPTLSPEHSDITFK